MGMAKMFKMSCGQNRCSLLFKNVQKCHVKHVKNVHEMSYEQKGKAFKMLMQNE